MNYRELLKCRTNVCHYLDLDLVFCIMAHATIKSLSALALLSKDYKQMLQSYYLLVVLAASCIFNSIFSFFLFLFFFFKYINLPRLWKI